MTRIARAHTRTTLWWVPAVMLLVLLSTACGPPSAGQQIADVLVQWHHDVGAGRMSEACTLMTRNAQQTIAEAVPASDCLAAMTAVGQALTADDRAAFANVSVSASDVTVNGSDALVAAGGVHYRPSPADWSAFNGPVPFHGDGHTWKIASVVQ